MKFKEVLLLSLKSIKSTKLRSGLTIFSVMIGVFAVISVMTVISILSKTVQRNLAFLGSNSFEIVRLPEIILNGDEWRKYNARPKINYQQVRRFEQAIGNFAKVCPMGSEEGQSIFYEGKKTKQISMIYAGNEYGIEIYKYEISEGRNIVEKDVEASRNVAVIGYDIHQDLFGSIDPIGKVIRLKGTAFTVVGVLAKKGQSFGESQDNFVLIPITSFVKVINPGKNQGFSVSVIARSQEMYQETIDRAIGQFRIVRGLKPEEENDFEINTNDALLNMLSSLESVITTATFIISFISLIVAGVGIMNIMLVSVVERTKEIGIRKALGARRNVLLLQFLTEAILLCLFGCALGILAGVAVGNAITFFFSVSPIFPFGWSLFSVLVCFLIGIIFGAYPARRAANLNPVEALRFE